MITIRSDVLNYKDPDTGDYVGINSIAVAAGTDEIIAAIKSEGARQITDVRNASGALYAAIAALEQRIEALEHNSSNPDETFSVYDSGRYGFSKYN